MAKQLPREDPPKGPWLKPRMLTPEERDDLRAKQLKTLLALRKRYPEAKIVGVPDEPQQPAGMIVREAAAPNREQRIAMLLQIFDIPWLTQKGNLSIHDNQVLAGGVLVATLHPGR